MDAPLCQIDGPIRKKELERTLVFLVNCSKGTMFMESIDASSMIKTRENMFELLDKQVVGEKNVVQVITNSHSSYKMASNKYYLDRNN